MNLIERTCRKCGAENTHVHVEAGNPNHDERGRFASSGFSNATDFLAAHKDTTAIQHLAKSGEYAARHAKAHGAMVSAYRHLSDAHRAAADMKSGAGDRHDVIDFHVKRAAQYLNK